MTVPAPREEINTDSVPVMIARLEGKVDAALAQQGAVIANHDDDIKDHEKRLRAVEDRSTVTWKQLWAAVGSAAAVFAALSSLIQELYAVHH